MPTTPKEHWDYTINEWTRQPFMNIFDLLPQDLEVIYDIGANVGGFSYVIKQRYPKAKIYAFEPVKANFEALVQNMPDIISYRKGIFYGKSESRVVSRGDNNIGGIFIEHIKAGDPMVFTDEILELEELENFDIERPDLIKMDIEGAEENVLELSTITRDCPYLIVEWHPPVDPFSFFEKNLPKHEILFNHGNYQFLLKLK